jgi:hypothetical protein
VTVATESREIGAVTIRSQPSPSLLRLGFWNFDVVGMVSAREKDVRRYLYVKRVETLCLKPSLKQAGLGKFGSDADLHEHDVPATAA